MQLVNIGFGSLISAERLIAVVSPDSAPVKRLVQEARDRGMLIDATFGAVGAQHGKNGAPSWSDGERSGRGGISIEQKRKDLHHFRALRRG